ncbi:MAG: hypothetical protein KGI70_03290 [Patescibacteria group bacterium]|nr:hypothetical protein [Patescibacteria group bacterium]
MSWKTYKPTAAEKRAIEAAYRVIEDTVGERYGAELAKALNDERRGYGVPSERLPLIGAKSLIVQWVVDGIIAPKRNLADLFGQRPSAVWAQCAGAAYVSRWSKEQKATILAGKRAHDVAFNRMIGRED